MWSHWLFKPAPKSLAMPTLLCAIVRILACRVKQTWGRIFGWSPLTTCRRLPVTMVMLWGVQIQKVVPMSKRHRGLPGFGGHLVRPGFTKSFCTKPCPPSSWQLELGEKRNIVLTTSLIVWMCIVQNCYGGIGGPEMLVPQPGDVTKPGWQKHELIQGLDHTFPRQRNARRFICDGPLYQTLS